MKKLYRFFFTIFLFCITFSSFCFAGCDSYSGFDFSISGSDINYIDGSGNSSVLSTQYNNPVYLSNFRSLNQIRAFLDTNYDSTFYDFDYVYIDGSFTFYSQPHIDSNNNIYYDSLPDSLPAPSLGGPIYIPCEYLSITLDNSLPSYFTLLSDSNNYIFNTFSYTLKCPITVDNSENENAYLNWFITYPTSSNNFSLLHDLGFIFHISPHVILSKDVCSYEDIQHLNIINDSIIDVGDKLDNIDSFMSDDDIDSAVLGADNFFNQSDTELSTFGLADFVSAGINFIKAIRLDYACVPLQLPAILGTQLTLPCFTEWLYNFNENIYNLYHIILTFYIGYLICSDLIRFIHNLRDPQNDNITVLEI